MDSASPPTVTAYLGLGSNLGDRLAALCGARAALDGVPEIRVLESSRLYETAPVGGPPGQGPYLNGVLSVDTTLSPLALLDACLAVEEAFGRHRRERWGARTLDLDLLFHGRTVREDARLILPHPRLHQRAFILVPLEELAPGLVHPRLGLTVRQLLERLPDRGDVKLQAINW
ncbi:MAG TPA: 2-amino-4-hydroxy-6-hydroxymethyldihydropteridine diphosphokinase [Deferrimonas sp.]